MRKGTRTSIGGKGDNNEADHGYHDIKQSEPHRNGSYGAATKPCVVGHVLGAQAYGLSDIDLGEQTCQGLFSILCMNGMKSTCMQEKESDPSDTTVGVLFVLEIALQSLEHEEPEL
eukprot:1335523-Amorphochlora_amoeboformis.AAC.2